MQNAFAAGTCTVAVYQFATQLWSGTLGLNQTSESFSDGASSTLTVNISEAGVLTLIWAETGTPPVPYRVVVTPSYSVEGYGMSVSGITITNGFPGTVGDNSQGDYGPAFAGEEPTTGLQIAGSGSTWTDDPTTFSDGEGTAWVLYTGFAS